MKSLRGLDLRFGSRWQRAQTYTSLAAWSALALADDDELTWEDTPETLYLGMRLGLIWSPQIALAVGMSATPLNIVEGAALAGLGISFAIGGLEGAETYVDYITDPVDMIQDPGKAESLMKAHRIMMAGLTLGGSEIASAGLEVLGEFKEELFKNRWKTGPYLPF